MKRFFAILAAGLVIAGLYFFLRRSGENLPDSTTGHSDAAQNVSSRPSQPERTIDLIHTQASLGEAKPNRLAAETLKPATPFLLGSADSPPAMSPDIVLGKMRIVVHQYQSMFGENPTGTNPEITDALNGGNPKQARLINEESGLRINGRGELVDSWGTPFFFHQLSGTEMEIRSAGPDKKMWTADDLVTR
jgi:hypothetical protein